MDTPKEISINRESINVETVEEPDDNSDNNDGDEGFQGIVAAHNQRRHPSIGSTKQSGSNSASSWASMDDLKRETLIQQRQQAQKAMEFAVDSGQSPPRPVLRRRKTPTTNNLSTASGGFFSEFTDSIAEEHTVTSMVPPTLILEGDGGVGVEYPSRNNVKQEHNILNPQQNQKQSSYRKSLAVGMLETLNVLAGITLSTTGTVLRPATAVTRDFILPGLIATLADTLDVITPDRVQDWFRIISTSVHHFFVVLVAGSTEKGKKFRNQVMRVARSFLEAWSAPESRQVVVDGMATGVRLADALHTPEVEVLLDQLSILGCRLVDAMASGKTKEFLHNTKDLVWASIELACDPSTTLALAEVTAHLCHALKEVDDSFPSATPRAMRNAHNEKTYLNPSMMGSHESIEQIILSSLGMHGDQNDNESVVIGDGVGDSADNDSAVQSIPSNVAFRVDEDIGIPSPGIPNLKHPNQNKKDDNQTSSWEKCKERVDLDLLQKKILHEGRPLARPQIAKSKSSISKERTESKTQDFANRVEELRDLGTNVSTDLGEDFQKIEEEMEDLPLPHESKNPPIKINLRNAANTKDLYDKFERMEVKESDQPSHVLFFNAVNKLLSEKRKQKEHEFRGWKVAAECDGNEDRDESNANNLERKARIRKLQKGFAKEEKSALRAVRERYSDSRRSWKYPPFLLRYSIVIVLFFFVFWLGFGIYGMYALFHQVIDFDRGTPVPPVQLELHRTTQHQNQDQLLHQHQPLSKVEFDDERTELSENKNNDDRQYSKRTTGHRSNEIIIRIVKEIVHVREDGSRIENDRKTGDNFGEEVDAYEDLNESVFSQDEIDEINKFIASHLEERHDEGDHPPNEVRQDDMYNFVDHKEDDPISWNSVGEDGSIEDVNEEHLTAGKVTDENQSR